MHDQTKKQYIASLRKIHHYRIEKIKMLLLDIDGTLTDGGIFVDKSGDDIARFNCKDGHGIQIAREKNLIVGAITGRISQATEYRCMQMLNFNFVYTCKEKRHMYERCLDQYALKYENVAFMGDDIMDLDIIQNCGISCCPADAHDEVKKHCDIISLKTGGNGAVRDFIDFLCKYK